MWIEKFSPQQYDIMLYLNVGLINNSGINKSPTKQVMFDTGGHRA